MSCIPDFTNNGYYLPKGQYSCTMLDIEGAFLFSNRRCVLWRLFKDFAFRLSSLGVLPDAVLINGSFVTKRHDPGDVDFVFLIPIPTVNNALANARDEHDKEGILMLFHPDNQIPIRNTHGVHFLCAHDKNSFNYWSDYFQNNVREPDSNLDPPWVRSASGKGILYLEGDELIHGI